MCLQIQVMQSWRKTSKIYKVFKKGPFFSSFENSLLMLQAHLQNGICFICFIWVLFACLLFDSLFFQFFSNLNRNPLSDIQRTITLSHSVGFLSTQLIVSLAVLKLFSFMTSHLSILGQTESYFRRPFLHLHHLRRGLCFQRFQCFRFWAQVSDHLELVFVQGNIYESSFILLHMDIHISYHRLSKSLSSLQPRLLTSLSKIKWLQSHVFMYGSLMLCHWSTCLFLCQYLFFITILSLNLTTPPVSTLDQLLLFLLMLLEQLKGETRNKISLKPQNKTFSK